jgi:tryptophan synthase beta chain
MADPVSMFFGIGSVVGPHPFPMMVRDFQAVVGFEAKRQFAALAAESASGSSAPAGSSSLPKMAKTKPDVLLACVGGGCNSLGLFTAFLDDPDVALIGVEPAGHGLDKGIGQHSATLTLGTPGVIHGMSCIVLQDEHGQPHPVHSCASGLDYPGVGPQHSFMFENGRVRRVRISVFSVFPSFPSVFLRPPRSPCLFPLPRASRETNTPSNTPAPRV